MQSDNLHLRHKTWKVVFLCCEVMCFDIIYALDICICEMFFDIAFQIFTVHQAVSLMVFLMQDHIKLAVTLLWLTGLKAQLTNCAGLSLGVTPPPQASSYHVALTVESVRCGWHGEVSHKGMDADTKNKVPSGENSEPKHYTFKAWSRSVYSRTCYAYCQVLLPG